jgi:hypothetical protein
MTANAGIIDPCLTYWELRDPLTDQIILVPPAPPCPLFVCPQGDTDSFQDQGWYLFICVQDGNGDPIASIPPTDFWLIDCDPLADASLCGGSASSGADAMTDALGTTEMRLGNLTGGGCVDGMALVVQGFVVLDPASNCVSAFCCPIWMRSPDMTGDLVVNLVDLSSFAAGFPPQPFDTCADMNLDGAVALQDLSRFAFHFGPPGHICN